MAGPGALLSLGSKAAASRSLREEWKPQEGWAQGPRPAGEVPPQTPANLTSLLFITSWLAVPAPLNRVKADPFVVSERGKLRPGHSERGHTLAETGTPVTCEKPCCPSQDRGHNEFYHLSEVNLH